MCEEYGHNYTCTHGHGLIMLRLSLTHQSQLAVFSFLFSVIIGTILSVYLYVYITEPT